MLPKPVIPAQAGIHRNSPINPKLQRLKNPWTKIDGCYLSAFVSPPTESTTQYFVNADGLAAYENKIGRKLAIVMIFLAWGKKESMQPFPKAWCQAMSEHGAIPHITWEPWDFVKTSESYRNPKIAAGLWDDYIRSWARDIKAWGQPLFLRWGHEMNADWYPWAGGICEGGAPAYVAAYRHIVELFRAEGASNVIWIWCPDTVIWNSQQAPFKYEPYYPGDDVVDWIAFDGYNFAQDADPTKPWVPFTKLYADIYERCSKLNTKAPFMIGEFASGEKGGSKAQWITDAYAAIQTQFPRIKAVTWFDIDKESHWPVDSSVESLAAFRAAVGDGYFRDHLW